MYECFHCGCRSVIWNADFDSKDYWYEEPGIVSGIVHECYCKNCGAYITYFVPINFDEDKDKQ